jgi:glycerophosphoryl diester phosphodiesterase
MRTLKPLSLAALAFCCIIGHPSVQAGRWYVKTTGSGTGASWGDPLSPEAFVGKLANGFQDNDTIYIAGGVYYPGADKASCMAIEKGLTLVGGFDPSLTGSATDISYPSPHETVFSGDVDKNGKLDNANAGCVMEISSPNGVTLKGITVSGGYRSGGGSEGRPGGIDVKSGARAALICCKVKGNKTESSAGGIYVSGGSLYCYKTIISENEGNNRGAGIRIQNGATLTLDACLLVNNRLAGDWGGAVQVSGANNPLYCINTTIANNTAGQGGAAINSPGDVYIISSTIANNVCANPAQGHDLRCESTDRMHIISSIITGYPDFAPNIFLNGGDKKITSLGYNVLGTCGGTGVLVKAETDTLGLRFRDVFGANILSENGGYPKTIALATACPGAPLDILEAYAGAIGLAGSAGKDQRGFERPAQAPSAGAAEKSVRVQQSKVEKMLSRLKHIDSAYVFVIAHRGDWRSAPENSIPAIEKAAEMGVDMVEIDIQKTKEGDFVLMHDGSIDRTTNGQGSISSYTVEQLKRYRLRHTDGALSNEKIPTLREALLACKKGQLLVNIDKGGDYLAEIMPIINETEAEELVVLKGTGSPAAVKSMLKSNLGIAYMPVVDLQSSSAQGAISSFLADFKPCAMEVSFAGADFNPSSYTQSITGAGCRVWINSLWESLCGAHEDEKAMSDPDAAWGWLLEKGASMIQTDRPKELIRYLQKKGLREPSPELPEEPLPAAMPAFANAGASIPLERLSNGSGAWGDFNNDGYLDLFCIGANINSAWTLAAHLYQNNGNGTFSAVETPVKKLREASCAWIDFNNDGNLDLLISGSDGSVSTSTTLLYKNKGAADGYALEEVLSPGLEHVSNESEKCYRYLAVGDYDNDGFQDILLTGQNRNAVRRTTLYKNDGGSGAFLPQDSLLDGGALRPYSSGCVAFGDMDGDGYLDILSTGYGDPFGSYPVDKGGFKVYRNLRNGAFARLEFDDEEWGAFLGQCAWADVNGDGWLDFIITGKHRNNSNQDINQAKLYLNNGSGGFTQRRSADANLEPLNVSALDWVDVNNDGQVDLVMSGSGNTSNSKTWVYLNSGEGVFHPHQTAIAPVRTGAVAAADYDRDGLPDVFICGYRDGSAGGSVAEVWKNGGKPGIPANAPPLPPANLRSESADGYTTFEWDAPDDDFTPAAALRYNLYVADTAGKILQLLVPADTATGFVKVADIAPALTSTAYRMKLATDAFSWGVQAIDNGKSGSPFAVVAYAGQAPGPTAVAAASADPVAVYPNPADDYVTVSFGEPAAAVLTLTNLAGTTLFRATAAAATFRIDLAGYPAGVYLLTIESGKTKTVKKLLLEK